MAMLIQETLKYIETTPKLGNRPHFELYNVKNDPAERVNLASGSIPTWHKRLAALRTQALEKGFGTATTTSIDERSRERLKALGYVN